jgi:hypothetical protein
VELEPKDYPLGQENEMKNVGDNFVESKAAPWGQPSRRLHDSARGLSGCGEESHGTIIRPSRLARVYRLINLTL